MLAIGAAMPPRKRTFPLVAALDSALNGLDRLPEDGAALQLARRYAARIDEAPEELVKLGPLLLATLTSLAMTPAGRAALVRPMGEGGGQGDGGGRPESKADELRRRRAARQHAAAPVD